jgi:hypothetical protein
MTHNYLSPHPDPRPLSIVMPFYNEEEMFPLLRSSRIFWVNHTILAK